MLQDNIFLDREGDAWFARNQAALDSPSRWDGPLTLAARIEPKERIGSIAEVGCSNGWRLAALGRIFPGARRSGVDVSAKAVEDGARRWPELHLARASAADIPLRESFDLVIVNFVLHWIDRATLARSIAEIDRLVADGGYLIVGDFLPDRPSRRRYHHLSDGSVYTYKQDYPATFLALGTYRELERVVFDHDDPGPGRRDIPSDRRAVCSLLQRTSTANYPEVT